MVQKPTLKAGSSSKIVKANIAKLLAAGASAKEAVKLAIKAAKTPSSTADLLRGLK